MTAVVEGMSTDVYEEICEELQVYIARAPAIREPERAKGNEKESIPSYMSRGSLIKTLRLLEGRDQEGFEQMLLVVQYWQQASLKLVDGWRPTKEDLNGPPVTHERIMAEGDMATRNRLTLTKFTKWAIALETMVHFPD